MNDLSGFLDYLTFEKRFSLHTIEAYSGDLEQFTAFLKTQYQTEDLREASHFMIRSWIVEMIENQIEARSVVRKITTLRTFYKYLVRIRAIERTPMLKVQAPKMKHRLPEYVDQTRMEPLLETVPAEDDFRTFRNWLLVDFLYRTGVRRAELIGLRVSDVNLHAMTFTVTGKRNKMRQIPFTPEFRDTLKNYLRLRSDYLAETGAECDSFFISDRGNQITKSYVYNTVKAAVSLVSTGVKRSPHVLRHSFATAMLNNGADINSIKELLGHSSLAATQVYTHNSIEKLREVYRRAFPKA